MKEISSRSHQGALTIIRRFGDFAAMHKNCVETNDRIEIQCLSNYSLK